ncbi:MAG: LysM domain-containing protein [Anaerolineae bacterium]|nr:LysM peptidoglycan-binding domain-containing protein [Anaerolineae bacterium]MDW8068312.1 LysM domain-containing protein [Anaerolineae bacterium]
MHASRITNHEFRLVGKGLWLSFSGDLNGTLEVAVAIGATHLIYRVGVRGMFFVEAAGWVERRVRQAGLVPLAWVPLSLDDPFAEAALVIKAWRAGYEGVVLDLTERTAGKTVAAATLGRELLETGVEPERLYYAAPPDIWRHPEIPYRDMNRFCQGGWMPWCVLTTRRTPRTVIDKWAYGEHARWGREWGNMPPLYPVLAISEEALLPGVTSFLEWVQELAAHHPPFLSLYGIGALDPKMWPILASLGPSAAPPPPRRVAPPPPVPTEEKPATAQFHIVTVNDTIWSICKRYHISRAQFWEWNGHLWDEQGLPRDEVYMQEGWRVRVG